jgi:hypothetical protein
MSLWLVFFYALAVGGVVNLIVVTVHAWQQEVIQPYGDWVDDRVMMAREYRP